MNVARALAQCQMKAQYALDHVGYVRTRDHLLAICQGLMKVTQISPVLNDQSCRSSFDRCAKGIQMLEVAVGELNYASSPSLPLLNESMPDENIDRFPNRAL